jgi:UDP-N-acetylglucosamine 4,6-dehydratase
VKKVLVTGGCGFVGYCVVRELLARYPDVEVTSMSRTEGELLPLMQVHTTRRLRAVLADVRDADAMKFAAKYADTLIHLAAMKRIDLCEEQSPEAISTNVIGTMNALHAFDGETFLFMSTNKAVEPTSCYGCSKLVAEKLVLEQAGKRAGKARFMIIRAGNVGGSTGGVVEIWKQQIEESNEITVTNFNMPRSFTSLDDVADLIMAVLERGENGKVYLTPHTQTVKLGQLAEEVIKEYGNERTRIRIVGMRPGEKIHEKTHLATEENVVVGFNRGARRGSRRGARTVLVYDKDFSREGAPEMARVNL